MTPEELQMLKETRALVEENSIILRSIQRHNRIQTAFKWAYWGLIIFLSFGAYYLIQPYVNALKSAVGDATGSNIFSSLGQ